MQWVLPIGVWAYWLYFLGHDLHEWPIRLWAGAFLATGTALGFLFERWRWHGDRLARLSFFTGLGPLVTGMYLGTAGASYEYTGAGIEAAGAIAALAAYAFKRRADRKEQPTP